MAVCGCGTGSGCTCVINGDKGIKVGTDPAEGIDFVITLDLTSGTPAADAGCGEVMTCVGGHIKDGLSYDPNTQNIAVKLDLGFTDNGISITPDGLYVPQCPSVGVGTCGGNFAVADLPDTGVLCGNEGTGTATNPAWTREMMSHGHANADTPLIFTITPVELADGTLWWLPPTGNTPALSEFNQVDWNASTDLTKIYGQQASLVHYNLDGTVAANTRAFCGQQSPGEESISVNDLLARLGGVAILRFRLGSLSVRAQTRLQTMILKMGLTKSVMLLGGITTGSQDRQTLRDWAAIGGVSSGIVASQAAADTALANSAAILLDGIRWLYVHPVVNDATFTALKAAGFTVMMYTDTFAGLLWGNGNRIRDLALKGGCSHDPFYSLQPARNYDARGLTAPWRGSRHAPGMYTGRANVYDTSLNCNIRGSFVLETAGQWSPTTDVWFRMTRTFGGVAQSAYTFQGWASPLTPTPGFVITGILRMSPQPTTTNLPDQQMGIAFAMTGDNGVNIGGAPTPTGTGYVLWIHGDNRASLQRIDAAGNAVTVGAIVAASTANEVAFTVTVTPTTVSATVQPFGSGVLVLANNVVDATPRGVHMYTMYRSTVLNNNWDALFRNFVVTPL